RRRDAAMASLNREGEGFCVQFVAADGKRRSVRLGKVPRKAAESFKVRVEELASAQALGGAPNLQLARWGAGLSDRMADRLHRAGLIPARRVVKLEAFLERYLASRTDVSAGTRRNLAMWAHEMAVFLGDVPLAHVTPGDLDDFAARLRTLHAPATAARRVK